MIRLERNKMENAILKAKAVRPRVKFLADRTFSVSGSRGNAYTVRFAVANGQRLGECDCPAGQSGHVCYHIAAAAAVNIGIQGMRRQASLPAPVAPTPQPEAAVIIRPSAEGYRVHPPYKHPAFVRAFKTTVGGRWYADSGEWFIAPDKLPWATELLGYWFKMPVVVTAH
jgi:hypothetical protein